MDGFRAEALETLCTMFPKVDRRILRAALMEAKDDSSVEAVIDEVIDFVAELASSSSSSEADANDIPDSQDFKDSEQAFASGNVEGVEESDPVVESFIFSGNSAPSLEAGQLSAYPIITEVTDDDIGAFSDAKAEVTSEPTGTSDGTTATSGMDNDNEDVSPRFQSSQRGSTSIAEGVPSSKKPPLESDGMPPASGEELQIEGVLAENGSAKAAIIRTPLDPPIEATSTLSTVTVPDPVAEHQKDACLPVPVVVASDSEQYTGSANKPGVCCPSEAAASEQPASASTPTEGADLAADTLSAAGTAADAPSADTPSTDTPPDDSTSADTEPAAAAEHTSAETTAADTTPATTAGADLTTADGSIGDISTCSSSANSVYDRWSSSFVSVDVADISSALSDLKSAEQQLVADVAYLSELLSSATSLEQRADEAEASLPFAGAATLEEAGRISADVAAFRDVLERRAADVWGETSMLGEEAVAVRRRVGQVKDRLDAVSTRLGEIRAELSARLALAEDRLRAAETSHQAAERAAEEARAAAEGDMQQALADEQRIAEREQKGGELARELEVQKEALDVLVVQLGGVEAQIEALLGQSVFGLVGGEAPSGVQGGSVHEGAVLVPAALSHTAPGKEGMQAIPAAAAMGASAGEGRALVDGNAGAASELFASASEDAPDSSIAAVAASTAEPFAAEASVAAASGAGAVAAAGAMAASRATAGTAAAPFPAASASLPAAVSAAESPAAALAASAGSISAASSEDVAEDAAFAENMRRMSEELQEEEQQGAAVSAVTAYRHQQQQQLGGQEMLPGAGSYSEAASQSQFVLPKGYHAGRPIHMIPMEGSGNHGGLIEVVDEDGWGVVIQAESAEGGALGAAPPVALP